MAKVLVADDEHSICEAFSRFLELEKHIPLTASNGREALEVIDREKPQVVFLDIQMPGMNGLETLEQIHSRDPKLPVIMMTAYGTMHTAMEAMRLGAFDYLAKPVDLGQIRSLLNSALQNTDTSLQTLKQSAISVTTDQDSPLLIGNSSAMQEMFKLMGLLTTNDLTVLLAGESGVGKELVARAIHFNSDRKTRPFIAINCAAIPENLMESELFGHERGAFTGADSRRAGRFEAAEDGTIFLDEIGELPLHLQSKLLRVLQERYFERVGSVTPLPLRARVIASTNRDLDAEIAAGRFREDLYYRIKMVTLPIPPLRKRKEDIDLLIHYFLDQSNQELGRNIETIDTEALEKLHHYDWPGNVRELEHTIKRAALVSKGVILGPNDLAFDQQPKDTENQLDSAYETLRKSACDALRTFHSLADSEPPRHSIFHTLIEEVEHELVAEALRMTDGNQVAAAKLLGVHRTTMRKKRRQD